jgi:trehalose utilization protein
MRLWLFLLLTSPLLQGADAIKVLVWDERQPRQSEAYNNFLGNEIAARLGSEPGLKIDSVGLDDPGQGLDRLDDYDVLIWWGHVRQDEVADEVGQHIVQRIRKGSLALITLHSAHWSVPFMEAMFDRTREDAKIRYPHPDTEFEFIRPRARRPPTYDSIVTPAYYATRRGMNAIHVRVDLPNCVFPGVRADSMPSLATVLMPEHPIMQGLPRQFEIPETEMYDEPFHVPEADAVLFREDWKGGGRFPGGMIWNLGEGKVLYFRPGHEQYPVFKDQNVMKMIDNAVRWLGSQVER